MRRVFLSEAAMPVIILVFRGNFPRKADTGVWKGGVQIPHVSEWREQNRTSQFLFNLGSIYGGRQKGRYDEITRNPSV